LSGKTWVPPQHERIEPSLSRVDRGNDEIFEKRQLEPSQIELLRAYTRRSLVDVARPVGRSAVYLDIFVDEIFVGQVTEDVLRRLANEEAIFDYVDGIRHKKKPPAFF
jgi:hypothetical protein